MEINKLDFDYVVIGAGSAGCVLANRLSANPANDVALLEAGGKDNYPWIHIPIGYFKTLHNPKYDWCYRTEPDPGLNGRSLEWPRGKVLGGSSSINGLLYIRGQKEDYDLWRQLGNIGWGFDDVLPYFVKSESNENGSDAYHGADGPLAVSNIRVKRGVTDAFIESAASIGIPKSDDFNGESQEGVGYFQLTKKNGLRWSSAKAYLKPARSRQNLSVVTHALARRIVFEGKKAVGVEISRNGKIETIRARKEVILSAGAIGSPQILQLSGVGPASVLKEQGIDVLSELKGVGENLQDHLQIRSVYKTSEKTLNDEANSWFGQVMIGAQYMLQRRGPMAMGVSQVCAFARSDEALDVPDIQFHIQPLSTDNPGHGLHKFSAFTSSVCQLRPESRGHVHINSADPEAYPKIFANYLATETDCSVAIRGVRLGRKIAKANPLASMITDEHEPGWNLESDDEILDWVRNRATTIYHPTSTCKMGNDDMSVVDNRLKVHGFDGLRVADASIMPTLVSGNTNAPSIMIGEKASDLVLEDAV